MNFKSSLFSALAFSVAVFAAADNPLKLWYNSDAGGEFTNALPIGNGYMGGLIYGGVTKDVIGLNESTVWSGGPGDNNKQGAASHLKDARDAMFRGAKSFSGSSHYSIFKDHLLLQSSPPSSGAMKL